MEELNEINKIFDKIWYEYCEIMNLSGKEIWKQIDDFPRYEISNMGRVRIVESGKVMKPSIRSAYQCITFNSETERRTKQINRIVAKYFVINPKPKLYDRVDHINENKLDDRAINLRWCTQSLNMLYHYQNKEYIGKVILQHDLEDNFIKEWKNIRELMELNKDYKYNCLLKVLTGGLDKLYGYKWKYKENRIVDIKDDEVFKKIGMYGKYDFSNFEVSNYGKVRNKTRNNMLKMRIGNDGYYIACLYDKITKKAMQIRVHKLVASKFVKYQAKGRYYVNHKDENKLNNHYKNLQWLTNQENVEYSHGIKIKQINKDTGRIIKTFKSIQAACKFYNYGVNSHVTISKCCRGVLKSAYKYKWEYV